MVSKCTGIIPIISRSICSFRGQDLSGLQHFFTDLRNGGGSAGGGGGVHTDPRIKLPTHTDNNKADHYERTVETPSTVGVRVAGSCYRHCMRQL